MTTLPSPRFAIVGAAGYIAPRHGDAIRAVGGQLVAACDLHDSVGWLDRDWPECAFHHSLGDMLASDDFDTAVICTPNHLHATQASMCLASDRAVICEKPLALTTADLDLIDSDRLRTILQLRHQSGARAAKDWVKREGVPEAARIEYHAFRGPWYGESWKGDPTRSGGVLFNIGSHPVDLACWLFGEPTGAYSVVDSRPDRVWFTATFGRTVVVFHLSTHTKPTRRCLEMDGAVFDLSDAFADLHVRCYEEILMGQGPGVPDVRASLGLCEQIAGARG